MGRRNEDFQVPYSTTPFALQKPSKERILFVRPKCLNCCKVSGGNKGVKPFEGPYLQPHTRWDKGEQQFISKKEEKR